MIEGDGDVEMNGAFHNGTHSAPAAGGDNNNDNSFDMGWTTIRFPLKMISNQL